MIPRSEPVTGGRAPACWDAPKETTNSPNICETDFPRRAACVFASATSCSSIRNVNFVFMTYILANYVRPVNPHCSAADSRAAVAICTAARTIGFGSWSKGFNSGRFSGPPTLPKARILDSIVARPMPSDNCVLEFSLTEAQSALRYFALQRMGRDEIIESRIRRLCRCLGRLVGCVPKFIKEPLVNIKRSFGNNPKLKLFQHVNQSISVNQFNRWNTVTPRLFLGLQSKRTCG